MVPGNFTWNSVDVLGDDGLLRYGRVVDVAEDGLIIDFLCFNRRREFTPFHKIFHVNDDRWSASMSPWESENADILMRDNASGAWTWFPAKILGTFQDMIRADYCVAIVYGGTLQEYATVVPKLRIRVKTDPNWRSPIQDNYKHYIHAKHLPVPKFVQTFVKRIIPLPEGCPAKLVAASLKQGKKGMPYDYARYHAHAVDIVDGCVVYLQCRPNSAKDIDDTYCIRHGKRVTVWQERLESLHQFIIQSALRMSEPLAEILPAATEILPAAEVAVLSIELWTEVFSHLDVITQVKQCRVCPLWNLIWDSASLKAKVILDSAAFTKEDQCSELKPLYFMTSALFKRISPFTQYITIADYGERMDGMDVVKILDILNFILQRNANIRPKGIFLYRLECYLLSFKYDGSYKFECSLRSPFSGNMVGSTRETFTHSVVACPDLLCHNIHLIKCTIALNILLSLELSEIAEVRHQRLIGNFGEMLWNAMEAQLPAPRETEVYLLSTWLKAIQADAETTGWAKHNVVCKTLCATQTTDPRPSLYYRGKRWCVDGLHDLQLKKLSPMPNSLFPVALSD
ncbi:uncharacterized protein LOC129582194 isoform X2 [Paramacrobiotus metropolitanus]|uniref:uncharacterized protein LOC129582194 isoform X2 n=1 Tax=Paramacrobiotus metropolitanus TaxID=2943436 RepID=UPI00244580FE|nr:uncharacterized protein LOC129582194 isoform X2 [Paramacrobiotus metropolitanus]